MVTVGENTQGVQRALGSARPMRVKRGLSVTTYSLAILRSLTRYRCCLGCLVQRDAGLRVRVQQHSQHRL